MSEGTAASESPACCANPFAAAHPIRRPVKLPGPSPTTMPSSSCGRTPACSRACSISTMISAAWRRAPCTKTPASVSGGLPTATLAISVAVSMASQTPPINPSPIADCGLRIAESLDERQIRNPQSAIRNHGPSLPFSPNFLQLPDIRGVTVTQSKVPIERRRPRARPLRPLDEHDGALARHVLKPDVLGLLGRLEAITIDVVHGGGASAVVMHQRVGGARRQCSCPQATADRLHQGRLARPQLARKPDDGRGRQAAAQRLTEPAEVVRAEAHAAPHLPGL